MDILAVFLTLFCSSFINVRLISLRKQTDQQTLVYHSLLCDNSYLLIIIVFASKICILISCLRNVAIRINGVVLDQIPIIVSSSNPVFWICWYFKPLLNVRLTWDVHAHRYGLEVKKKNTQLP